MQDESLKKWYFRKEYEKQTQIHWIKRTGSASLQGQYGKGSFLRGTLISNVTKWFSTHQKTSFGKEIHFLVMLHPGVKGRTSLLCMFQ